MIDEKIPADARGRLSRRRFLANSTLIAAGAANAVGGKSLLAQSTAEPQKAAPKAQLPLPPPVTHILADWAAHVEKSAIPATARKEAIRSIVNWLAAIVGGSQQDAVDIAVQTVLPLSGPHGGSLFGRAEKLDMLQNALVNGISSHVLDFDDTNLRTALHPAGEVAGSLFALCQTRKISGSDILHAFIVGVEVETRIALAITPSHSEMGWHMSGTSGTFGAAAACSKALGLDTRKTQMALGIAATEASGLKIEFGSMTKSLNVGRATENGLLAALLASNGFTSSEVAIEGYGPGGKDGYIHAASLEHDYSVLTDGLGQHFEINNDSYKPFACGVVAHPTIDAILQLRKEYNLKPADVRSIVLRVAPSVIDVTGKKEPRTGLEGKFSIYHSAAVAMVRGYAGPNEYSDEAVNDPEVVALRRRISTQIDSSVGDDEVYVTLTTMDGRVLTKHVEHAIGSLERPLTDKDLEEKFRQLSKGILPAAQAEDLLKHAWAIESLPDAAELPRIGTRQAGAVDGQAKS